MVFIIKLLFTQLQKCVVAILLYKNFSYIYVYLIMTYYRDRATYRSITIIDWLRFIIVSMNTLHYRCLYIAYVYVHIRDIKMVT